MLFRILYQVVYGFFSSNIFFPQRLKFGHHGFQFRSVCRELYTSERFAVSKYISYVLSTAEEVLKCYNISSVFRQKDSHLSSDKSAKNNVKYTMRDLVF